MSASIGWLAVIFLHVVLVTALLYGRTRLAIFRRPVLYLLALFGSSAGLAASSGPTGLFPVRYLPRFFVS